MTYKRQLCMSRVLHDCHGSAAVNSTQTALSLCSHSSLQVIPSGRKNVNKYVVFMSSTGQVTSSASNIQLIIDALADYAKITGIDLSKDSFAATLEQSNSIEAILQQLHEREKAFKEYRDGNRNLINCLSPAVKVLQAFSGILGEAVSLVSYARQHHLMSLLS